MRLLHITIMSSLLLAVCGCGDNVAPVSGRVTLDNKPLVNALVTYYPDSAEKTPGPGSQGKTDQQGQYTLKLMTKDVQGAMVGSHTVSITSYEGDDGKAPSSGPDMIFRKALVPEKYNANTQLKFEVPPGGSTEANFDLKSE